MKGFFGACLIGISQALMIGGYNKEWYYFVGGLLLFAWGLELLIDGKIEDAIEKLEDKVYDK